MSSFVRQDFYIPPPDKNAPKEEWERWLKADKQAAANAKRAHTMSLKAEPENAKMWHHGSGMPMRGPDGVHRQSEGFIGFHSNGADEKASVVAMVPATQDRYFQARDGRTRANAKVINISRRKARKGSRAERFRKR